MKTVKMKVMVTTLLMMPLMGNAASVEKSPTCEITLQALSSSNQIGQLKLSLNKIKKDGQYIGLTGQSELVHTSSDFKEELVKKFNTSIDESLSETDNFKISNILTIPLSKSKEMAVVYPSKSTMVNFEILVKAGDPLDKYIRENLPAEFESNIYKNMKGLYKLGVMITAERMYKTTFDGKLENPVFIADSNVTTKMYLNGAGRAEFSTPSTSGLIMSPECVNVVRGVRDL